MDNFPIHEILHRFRSSVVAIQNLAQDIRDNVLPGSGFGLESSSDTFTSASSEDLSINQRPFAKITSACNEIMRVVISYADGRQDVQLASRLKSIFDNNVPRWREDPSWQDLLLSIVQMEAVETDLQCMKDFIQVQSGNLTDIYNDVQHHYALCRLQDGAQRTVEIDGPMQVVHIMVAHARTSLHVISATDSRASREIHEVLIEILQEYGMPMPIFGI